MAYYMKKNKKEEEKKPEDSFDNRARRYFWQIVGCGIVLVIAVIIFAVKGN